MKKLSIVTDSNSGITQEEAEKIGIRIVPMPFILDGNAAVKRTQSCPETLMELWDEILEEYEEIIYIPMSDGLSPSVVTAKILADNYNGRVCVVNNTRIPSVQKKPVFEAVKMHRLGFDALQIRDVLEKIK